MSLLRRPPRLLLASLLLASLATAIVAGAVWLKWLDGLELRGYDHLLAARSNAAPPNEIVFVDFDDASVETLNAFPLPRALLADVVEKISAGHPKVIGLDILLDAPRDPADDQRLVRAIDSAPNVILAENYGATHLPPSRPLPQFRDAALDVGFVNLAEDSDGFVRRMYIGMSSPDYEGEAFFVMLAKYFVEQRLERIGPNAYRLGSHVIPLDGIEPNSALIGAWTAQPVKTVAVAKLIQPGFDSRIFEGKAVLIGQSSAKGKDLWHTPLFRFSGDAGRLISGTEIHAAAVATLLTGRTIRVLPPWQQWALNFLLAWLAVAVVMKWRPAVGVATVILGALCAYGIAHTLIAGPGVWMRFVATEVGTVLALPAGLRYRFVEERRLKTLVEAEQRELMGLFGRYVAPEVAAEIWNRRHELVLAGQERVATVLFSDIRSFTQITAGKPCNEVLGWLNDYFNAMSAVVRRNGGYLNKFMGDGLMVIFGVPLSETVEKDACRAVQAALEMLDAVEVLNARRTDCRPLLRIGIGLHTGPLTAGNVGACDRLEYSVIGETVNLASRLESLTKDFKSSVVMSSATHELVKDRFETRLLGETVVRGFADKAQLFAAEKRTGTEVEQ